MDPYDEQRLREEVLFLHSLWHKGPPTQHHQPPLHLPSSSSSSYSLHDLSNPPQFKRNRLDNKKKGQEYKKRIKELQSEQGREWPVNPTSSTSPAAVSGWPKTSSGSDSKTLLPSPEEQARLAANRAQLKALNATKKFLFSSNGSGEDEQDEYMDDDNDDLVEEDGRDAYSFFDKLFMEDGELKEYYLKNYFNGDFTCLVCGGIGKKTAWKKYKDCVAVIQHSLYITKNRPPHKAYGQVICKILGWEIHKLPQIISDLTVKVRESLNKSCASNGQAQENNAGVTKDNSSITENTQNIYEATHGEHQEKESGDTGNMLNNGEPVMAEEGFTMDDVPESAEDTISHPKTVDVSDSEKADHMVGKAKDGALNDPDHPVQSNVPS